MSRNKLIAIILVALIHVAIGYALVTGLAYSAIKKAVERVTTVDIEEPPPPEEEPPPPPEPDTAPPPPVAPPPPINISVAPPPIQVQTNIPPPAPPARISPPAAPPAPPPPPPSQARPARPDNQASWQRRIIENYPSRAIRDEIEGRVGVRVTVGANGRVSGCTVSSSSGSSILDQAACTDITRYARFDPALDDAGDPTNGSWGTTIVYQLTR
jgi:protein TonB